MKADHGEEASVVQDGGAILKGIAMRDMEHEERRKPLVERRRPEEAPKVEAAPDCATGFLFCPRCGQVVLGAGVNSLCPQCGHRFCPCCSD